MATDNVRARVAFHRAREILLDLQRLGALVRGAPLLPEGEGMTGIRPLRDRVLVRRLEETYGGTLIIPDSSKEDGSMAVVIAVGPGATCEKTGQLISPAVEEGEIVILGKYSGTEIKVEDAEMLFVKEDEILGVVD